MCDDDAEDAMAPETAQTEAHEPSPSVAPEEMTQVSAIDLCLDETIDADPDLRQ